jgi:hypothetical protein
MRSVNLLNSKNVAESAKFPPWPTQLPRGELYVFCGPVGHSVMYVYAWDTSSELPDRIARDNVGHVVDKGCRVLTGHSVQCSEARVITNY